MKTKTMMVALATLLIGSVCFLACQKELDIKESEYVFDKDATATFQEGISEGYLVGFHNTPDSVLILRAGGSIIRSYNNFPILHVNIPEQALAGLSRAPGISFIEPNKVRSISGAFSQNCPEDNLVCAEGQIKTFHMSRTGVQAAWRSGATGQGIRIAILDTGIDGNHKDLKDNLASDGFTVITTGSPPSRHWLVDPNGHGTHVAGTAGASGRLNGGYNALLGVAPEVTLVSVRVLRANASGSVADIAAGIDWCIDNNIDIINMSLGGSHSHAEYVVVETAWNAGLLIVASAGNNGDTDGEGENILYPAAYDEVIAVAATNQQVDGRRHTSSTGPSVELIAPGTQVFSTHINDYGYHYMSGTSMAAPHVSGVAALIWSANTSLTNQDIRDLLRDNAESLNIPFNHQGHGLVRADKAMGIETGRVKGLVYADNQPVYAANLTFSNGSNTFSTTSSGAVGYTIIVPPDTYTATASFNYGYDPVSTSVTVSGNEIAEINFSFTEEGSDPDPAPNQSPVAVFSFTTSDLKASFTDQSYDTDGTVVAWAWNFGDDATSSAQNPTHTYATEGAYNVTLTVTDNEGATGSQSQSVTVTAPPPSGNNPPSITTFDVIKSTAGPWHRAQINWAVKDQDGDLSTVWLGLYSGDKVLESINISVSGSSASGNHELRSRTNPTAVKIIVTDRKENSVEQIKSI